MSQRIALLADVHGNTSALKAVVEDSIREGVTDYWFLGDLIMPGPGANDLFDILEGLKIGTYVKGNWEDCFLEVLEKKIDFNDPTDLYIARLAQYQCEKLDQHYIDLIKTLKKRTIIRVNHLSISVSHNLPNKNYGGDLWPTNDQNAFDQLFDQDADIAIYAHTHHQLLRYSSKDQLIINPGTVGQPYYKWDALRSDRRAQYAILEIDEVGVVDVRFKKIPYDVENELKVATRHKLPYLELYQEFLVTGKTHTHDHDLLHKFNVENNYKEEIITYFEKHYW